MPKMTSYTTGQFSWVDLMSSDTAAHRDFYTALFGWDYREEPADDTYVYTLFTKDGLDVAGMGGMPEPMRQAGAPSMWQSYVTVENADEAAQRARDVGGATPMGGAFDALESGRMALVADPQGAMLSVWEPRNHIGAQIVNEPGTFCWNELLTNDVEGAKRFYGDMFGWACTTSDSGGMVYTEISNDGDPNGGMMEIMEQMGPVPPHWAVYFAVEDCDTSVAKVEELGGRVNVPPTDIRPGRFAHVSDPLGAVFYVMKLNLA
ncbi:MAG: VOC family protein [Actinobacteria bacterium ATB1]|nr:VOC family protein [Actinobacteria bacterium ATB1]